MIVGGTWEQHLDFIEEHLNKLAELRVMVVSSISAAQQSINVLYEEQNRIDRAMESCFKEAAAARAAIIKASP